MLLYRNLSSAAGKTLPTLIRRTSRAATSHLLYVFIYISCLYSSKMSRDALIFWYFVALHPISVTCSYCTLSAAAAPLIGEFLPQKISFSHLDVCRYRLLKSVITLQIQSTRRRLHLLIITDRFTLIPFYPNPSKRGRDWRCSAVALIHVFMIVSLIKS